MNERDHMEVDPLGVCGRQLEALQKENRIQKWWSFFLFNLYLKVAENAASYRSMTASQ